MNRRGFLKSFSAFAAIGSAGSAPLLWPSEGIVNPCLPPDVSALSDPWIRKALEGVDFSKAWDAHSHIAGTGDSGGGLWANPKLFSPLHPVEYAQREFYVNASCSDSEQGVDEAFVSRLAALAGLFPPGFKVLLFAFDRFHGEDGRPRHELSHFHVPDRLASSIAARFPERFEWACSIHPYRPDALEALREAHRGGARAVKWLPPSMGIDPSSPRCFPFYAEAARLGIPIISHAGDEHAAAGPGMQHMGNPLLLRAALERGVRVVVAHCATQGSGADLDRGGEAPNYDLFDRMMREAAFEGLLFGDISAIAQVNRAEYIPRILSSGWTRRLLNGSDYPLPGVMPLFDPAALESRGLLPKGSSDSLSAARRSNPLLFDFALKRLLSWEGRFFPLEAFHTRSFFLPDSHAL